MGVPARLVLRSADCILETQAHRLFNGNVRESPGYNRNGYKRTVMKVIPLQRMMGTDGKRPVGCSANPLVAGSSPARPTLERFLGTGPPESS